jgi:hypothetical protein
MDNKNKNNKLKEVRNNGLDKFYTKPEIAKKCINKINELYDIEKWDLIIEPSAGNGSFLLQIDSNNKIGLDILPEHDSIIKQDFFEYLPPKEKKNILIIGNPPFGKVSSLAIKFFNHAANFANTNVIAFIIPRTFRKFSVQNKLNYFFHLKHDEDIETKPCSFIPSMAVKCCFQIWEKNNIKRKIIKMDKIIDDWDFLSLGSNDENGQPTPPKGADFVIRAYGGKCGEIKERELEKLRPKSWHWIKSNIDIDILKERFRKLDYSNSNNTARQNSIGRGELIELYKKKFINKDKD